jgi:hypothetical protein
MALLELLALLALCWRSVGAVGALLALLALCWRCWRFVGAVGAVGAHLALLAPLRVTHSFAYILIGTAHMFTVSGGLLLEGFRKPEQCSIECQKLGMIRGSEDPLFFGISNNSLCMCSTDWNTRGADKSNTIFFK